MKKCLSPRICAIILAAGEGRRAGGKKLSKIIIEEKPILQHVVEKVLSSLVEEVVLVTGYEREFCEDLAEYYGLACCFNSNYKEGMATSIKIGVSKTSDNIAAILILLGDMPYVKIDTINEIVILYNAKKSKIIIPTYKGRKGHPILLSSSLKNEIEKISPENGLREVIERHKDEIAYVEVNDDGILKDIDYITDAGYLK